jgi:hypothetical protein
MKKILSALVILAYTAVVRAEDTYEFEVMIGQASAGSRNIMSELDNHFGIETEDASTGGIINLNLGIGLTYKYTEFWSTSLSVFDGVWYSTRQSCFLFCNNPPESYNLNIRSNIHLAQNHIIPINDSWYVNLTGGLNLTISDLIKESRNLDTGSYEIVSKTTDNDWGLIYGLELNYRLGESWGISYGYQGISHLSQEFTYIETSYRF